MSADPTSSVADGFRRVLAYEPASLRCPYEHYAELRRSAPVVWVPEISAFVISRFEDIAHVNRRPEVFSSSDAMGPRPLPIRLQEHFNELRRREGRPERAVQSPEPVLLTADPPRHTRHRALLSRAFGPRRVAVIEGRIRELAGTLIEAFADRGTCEYVAELAVPLPLTLLAEILGVEDGDLATFKRWSDDFSGLFGAPDPDEDRVSELAKSTFEFEAYFRARIEERRRTPRDDVLTDVVRADADGEEPLTADEIIAMFAQVLVAGNETTTKMLTYAAWFLAQRPDLAARLRADTRRIPGFVEEVLRLEAPIQGFWRRAVENTEVGEVAIPSGALVLLLYGSGNRDDAVFSDADALVVDRRAERPHLAFGLGAHFCIGANLARTEGGIATELMLATFDEIALAPDNRFEPDASYLLHGLQALHLSFERAEAT